MLTRPGHPNPLGAKKAQKGSLSDEGTMETRFGRGLKITDEG